MVGVDDIAVLLIIGIVMISTAVIASQLSDVSTSGLDISTIDPLAGLKRQVVSLMALVTSLTGSVANNNYVQSKSSSKSQSKAVPNSIAISETPKRDRPKFPTSPYLFKPIGLRLEKYPGTGNGRIWKWFDGNTLIFEWDEDYKYGSHYHAAVQGRHIKETTHYTAFQYIPEPYASKYF